MPASISWIMLCTSSVCSLRYPCATRRYFSSSEWITLENLSELKTSVCSLTLYDISFSSISIIFTIEFLVERFPPGTMTFPSYLTTFLISNNTIFFLSPLSSISDVYSGNEHTGITASPSLCSDLSLSTYLLTSLSCHTFGGAIIQSGFNSFQSMLIIELSLFAVISILPSLYSMFDVSIQLSYTLYLSPTIL